MNKKTYIWAVVLAALPVVLISIVARHLSGNISANTALNAFYAFIRDNLWQSIAVIALLLGIWFSLVRRRLFLSVFLLGLAFLSSFVLPNIF